MVTSSQSAHHYSLLPLKFSIVSHVVFPNLWKMNSSAKPHSPETYELLSTKMDLKQMSEEYQECHCILPLYLFCVPSTNMTTSATYLGGLLHTPQLYYSFSSFILVQFLFCSISILIPLHPSLYVQWSFLSRMSWHFGTMCVLNQLPLDYLPSVVLTRQFFLGPIFLSIVLVSDLYWWYLWCWKGKEGSNSSTCCIWRKPCLCGLMKTR